MIIAGLGRNNLKHIVMKRFAVSSFLFAVALMIGCCGSSDSLISGEQEFILETPIPNDPNDQSVHKATATEIEDGFKVVSEWGSGEFDSNMIRLEFSIDQDTKVGQEIPMEQCIFAYPYSSNIDYYTFTIKSGHVYLKNITDDQIVVRFKKACFSLGADRDYLLNGDLSFNILQ